MASSMRAAMASRSRRFRVPRLRLLYRVFDQRVRGLHADRVEEAAESRGRVDFEHVGRGPAEDHVNAADLEADCLRRADGDRLRMIVKFNRDALRPEMDVRPPFVVGGDPFHRPDDAVVDDQGSDVDAGIRYVFLEADDLAEYLTSIR